MWDKLARELVRKKVWQAEFFTSLSQVESAREFKRAEPEPYKAQARQLDEPKRAYSSLLGIIIEIYIINFCK